jgi:hypothetical protein
MVIWYATRLVTLTSNIAIPIASATVMFDE